MFFIFGRNMLTAKKRLVTSSRNPHLIKIMDSVSDIKDLGLLEALLKQIKEQKKAIKADVRKQRTDVVAIAQTLVPATQSVLDAQKAYEEKGFFVDIETDEKTGLIRKWKLKNRRPKNQNIGGAIRSASAIKQMKPNEFQQIVSRLPDVFGAKDIMNALIGSGIGERKLQPAFGNILKGVYGEYGIEKVPGMDQGPSVRYRKVK